MGGTSVRDVEVKEIWIDSTGRLCVRLADQSLDLSHIYRASASGVEWDDQLRAVCSPVPRDWSYADWFVRIVRDARSEYGVDFILIDSTAWSGISTESQSAIELARAKMPPYAPNPVDNRTMARYIGDDQLRRAARDLFLQGQWKAAVAKLETLQYPQFMDAADRRRLEIAKERSMPHDKETRGREIQDQIRQILLHDWDPIGVQEIPEAQGEYDSYVGGVYRLLVSPAQDEELVEHLYRIERETMGLGPRDKSRLLLVVQKLRTLKVAPR